MKFSISIILFFKYKENSLFRGFPIDEIIGEYFYPKNISPVIIIKAIDTYM
jgi:hypothetical protein|tara:strand:+ start:329 stop:481 length:153 start_codon:yes stop_codon:yes gene_type:complete